MTPGRDRESVGGIAVRTPRKTTGKTPDAVYHLLAEAAAPTDFPSEALSVMWQPSNFEDMQAPTPADFP